MHLAVDAQYQDDGTGQIAGVLFENIGDPSALKTCRCKLQHVAPYEPGQFYKRELPGILRLFRDLYRDHHDIDNIIIDGYVDLGPDRPGLGRHLFIELDGVVSVLGVAKTQFKGAPAAEVLRGRSKKPLYVTSTGLFPGADVELVQLLHGEHRIPTLLKLVDQLARQGVKHGD